MTTYKKEYRSEAEQQKAIASIRKFADNNELEVIFTEIALNPYANGARTMEIYEDTNSREYWIDPTDNRVIQSAPCAGKPAISYKVKEEDRLTVKELRPLAMARIKTQRPDFDLSAGYHPLEDNRNRQVYFFRYDSSEPTPESELPPFIQVGLKADGELVSFTDTLK